MSLLFRLLRIALALGLLVWVIRRLQWEEIAGFDWAGISLGWLGLAFLFGGLSLLGWAGRWWWFVRVYRLRVPFRELLRLTMFADFFNLYFLGPLGADGVRLLLTLSEGQVLSGLLQHDWVRPTLGAAR